MKTSESVIKIFPALLAAQRKMGNVVKNSKNPFFKSNYADINSLREEAIPVLNEEGLAVFQPPTTVEGKNYIETIIIHESGEFASSLNEVIVTKEKDPQSFLAAQTYTRRGALQAMLNMGAVDDDGNFASGKADKLEANKSFSQQKKEQAEVKPIKVSASEAAFVSAGIEKLKPAITATTGFASVPASGMAKQEVPKAIVAEKPKTTGFRRTATVNVDL